ncbi:hypothetical protein ANN_13756 [Periplaneta americana]|uniref:DUF4817 domain-containing protein n=1 Tax=Periplaneta americana TaxID=6978 RepID=A0ABQ8SUE2_PERAM|nr:hypothetical protein ANN_13756 [Periplaneta americana]
MHSMTEMTDMHYIYGLADGKTVAARQLYAERHAGRHLPCGKTFVRIHKRLLETGTFQKTVSDVRRPREVRICALEKPILRTVDETP